MSKNLNNVSNVMGNVTNGVSAGDAVKNLIGNDTRYEGYVQGVSNLTASLTDTLHLLTKKYGSVNWGAKIANLTAGINKIEQEIKNNNFKVSSVVSLASIVGWASLPTKKR